ncbi:MAG: NAD(P)-binding protein [Candidatus Omnitrophica bacterium]|nr:NAD(P)-binding protein [Candidatus Omnitrophota bacterium]
MSDKEENLIIGAGLSGLFTAYYLYKAKKSFIIIEKEKQVGGLAKTLEYDGFKTDIGPIGFIPKTNHS